MADTYKIIAQDQRTVINPQGNNFMAVWEITYQVTSGPAKGVTGTVQVADSDHNAKHIGAIIDAKIADLAAIHALGS